MLKPWGFAQADNPDLPRTTVPGGAGFYAEKKGIFAALPVRPKTHEF